MLYVVSKSMSLFTWDRCSLTVWGMKFFIADIDDILIYSPLQEIDVAHVKQVPYPANLIPGLYHQF